MKKIYQIVVCIAICFTMTTYVNGQFTQIPASNTYESAGVDKIGIGNFSATAGNVLSALHIDGNTLNTTTGEVFRTDGPTGSNNKWRLYTGGTERFQINVPLSSSNVELNAVQNAPMNFLTNNTARMKIQADGKIAIGNYTGFTAANLIHQYVNSASATYHQFTNSTTGSASTDGLLVGIDASSNGIINMQTDNPIFLYTNGVSRLVIDEKAASSAALAGFVGVGNSFTAPKSRLHINQGSNEDCWLQLTTTTTGSANATDGLRLGVTESTSAVEIKQQETAAMNFYTSSTQRMQIYDASASPTNAGYIGMGDFSSASPQSHLHMKQGSADVWLQMTNAGSTTHNSTDGLRIGIINSSGNVEIKQQENFDMQFYTNNSKQVIIKNDGKVGIGNNFTSPAYLLEVKGGDINVGVSSWTEVYRINGNRALAMPAGTKNICVGHNAGLSLATDNNSTFMGLGAGEATTTGGDNNSAFGSQALNDNTTGDNNVAVGYAALALNTTGDNNTALGTSSLAANTSGHENTAIGNAALNANSTGYYNTATGWHALTASTTGIQNTATGMYALQANTTGSNNTAFGNHTLFNVTTTDNNTAIGSLAGDEGNLGGTYTKCTFLGYNADEVTASNLDNATAVGANSQVNCSDCMVLGSSASGGFNQVQVGIGYPNPTTASTDQFLLYVNAVTCAGCPFGTGSGFFNGDIYAAGTFSPSDASLKNNIQPLQPIVASDILANLESKTYDFNQIDNPQLNLPSGLQYGLIAEDVEAVLPGLVKTITTPAVLDSLGNEIHPELTFTGVNYPGLIPLMLAVINGQGARISSLEQQISETTPRNQNPAINTGSVELENLKTLQLLQNDPNPFSESTMIRWSIPEDFNDAIIYFYDNNGNQINTYKISEKGAGEIQVFGSKLSSGVYTYTLVVDGKVIDSKKMMKAK